MRTVSSGVACGLGVLLVGAAGCSQPKERVTLAGSTAFQPFAEKLTEQFMALHPEANITVQGGGSAVGIQAVLQGTAQIGMADLVDLPPEASPLRAVVVARDGIALVVHPSNPVTNLTLAEVRAIFSGTLRRWSQVGGLEEPITVVCREAGSGTRASFESILGGLRLSPAAIIQDSNGTVRETVANDPCAIGYLSHGLVNGKIKPITIEGAACTPEDIGAKRYPFVRPIYFLLRNEPRGVPREFLNYVLSEAGQRILEEAGLIRSQQ